MTERRLHQRFNCHREVQVAFFARRQHRGSRNAVVKDISSSGLLLELESEPPPCDRVLIRTERQVLQYEVRNRREREGKTLLGLRSLGAI